MRKILLELLENAMKRRGKLSNYVDRIAVRIHKAYENLDYNFKKNGEFSVLQKISESQKEIGTIFDVGANNGDWSKCAAQLFPNTTIHAFEIVPETFKILDFSLRTYKNVVCNGFGFSDIEGSTPVFFSSDKDGIATCTPNFSEDFHKIETHCIEASVTTGDKFCMENGIDSIDYLKIDVEGHENKVLKGFDNMLKTGKIKVIQFEYGYVNVLTHFLLKDFYEYLESFNYKIGKIYPSYVDFREYNYCDENFYGPNYLAVHTSCLWIIDLLGKR